MKWQQQAIGGQIYTKMLTLFYLIYDSLNYLVLFPFFGYSGYISRFGMKMTFWWRVTIFVDTLIARFSNVRGEDQNTDAWQTERYR
jgi:hypothetical protein